jgi:hypothetical protein
LIFKSLSFVTLKASNIFELFSIFVAAFFPRNVSRADWVAKDGAWAARFACRRAPGLAAAVPSTTLGPCPAPHESVSCPCTASSGLHHEIGRDS